jgi:hypothetical protein
MMRRWPSLVLVALAASLPASSLTAQGTLSTQGFGYPLGGLSTRAAAGGGAFAEFDALSARNPGALPSWGRPGLYFQYDPEFRSVSAGNRTDHTTTARFPAVAVGLGVGQHGVLGLSNNGFLDRTFATVVRSGQRLGDDSVSYTERFGSSGAITDTRIAYAYQLSPRFTLGVGVHLFSGENRLSLRREFDDSLRYGTLSRTLDLSYSGTGISAGFIAVPVRGLAIAGSARQGGTLDLRVVDTLRSQAKVPSRVGLAARVDAIPGVSLSAAADFTGWSKMNGLGTSASNAMDTWEYSAGAQFSGQRSRNVSWLYSVGYRQRDLPFPAAGATVSEKIVSGGVTAPVAGPRASLDPALQRAARHANGGVSERAWLLSFGLTIRP